MFKMPLKLVEGKGFLNLMSTLAPDYKVPSRNTITYTSIIRIILLSGDISTNPGPVKYPRGKCSKPVKRNQRGNLVKSHSKMVLV
jgi:hypothetical protein